MHGRTGGPILNICASCSQKCMPFFRFRRYCSTFTGQIPKSKRGVSRELEPAPIHLSVNGQPHPVSLSPTCLFPRLICRFTTFTIRYSLTVSLPSFFLQIFPPRTPFQPQDRLHGLPDRTLKSSEQLGFCFSFFHHIFWVFLVHSGRLWWLTVSF